MVGLEVDGKRFRIEESKLDGAVRTLVVDGKPVRVEILREPEENSSGLLVRVGNRIFQLIIQQTQQLGQSQVFLNGKSLLVSLKQFEGLDAASRGVLSHEGPVTVTAPMAGRIATIKPKVGTLVEEGEALVVLEAMKMENEVGSPKKGSVKEIYVYPGALVRPGDKLLLVD